MYKILFYILLAIVYVLVIVISDDLERETRTDEIMYWLTIIFATISILFIIGYSLLNKGVR